MQNKTNNETLGLKHRGSLNSGQSNLLWKYARCDVINLAPEWDMPLCVTVVSDLLYLIFLFNRFFGGIHVSNVSRARMMFGAVFHMDMAT